jgi:hypothetical protein
MPLKKQRCKQCDRCLLDSYLRSRFPNPDSKHQVLTTKAHLSPGVAHDMQFLHCQYAVIATDKKLNSITKENVNAGEHYITPFGSRLCGLCGMRPGVVNTRYI